MNPQFGYAWLRHLNSNRQRGFAMPMAIMLGLVMVVVGVTLLVQSTGDQTKTISQKAKSGSNAAAEAGLARIQNLLGSAKFMAMYPSDKWTTAMTVNGSTVTINDPDLQAYVTKLATIMAKENLAPGVSDACNTSIPTSDQITAQETIIKSTLKTLYEAATASSENPINLVANDSSKGKFRLVKFNYQGYNPSPSPNGKSYYPPNGTKWDGQLVVEGQMPSTGNAVTTITAKMPISTESSSSSTPIDTSGVVPGIWVKEGGLNDASKAETSYDDSAGKVWADVTVSGCDNTGKPDADPSKATKSVSDTYLNQLDTAQKGYSNSDSNQGPTFSTGKYRAKRTDTPMPNIPAIPSGVTPYTLSGAASLPRSGEVAAADGYYYYKTTGNLGDLTIDHTGGKKYRIYLYGDIPKTTEVNSNCKNTSGCEPTNLQIFGMNSTGEICMNGNSDRAVDAFVLAPNYAMGKTGNGNFYGTFIVKSFGKIGNCGSNNGKLAIMSSQQWSTVPADLRPITAGTTYPIPALGSITEWQSLQTNTTPSPLASVSGGIDVASAPAISSSSSSVTSSASSSSVTSSSSSSSVTSSSSASSISSSSSSSSSVAMCTVPNYVGTKGKNIPTQWNATGPGLITNKVNGNSDANSQTLSAGSSQNCKATLTVN